MTTQTAPFTYDPLTGLLDRRSLLDALGAAQDECRRTGRRRIVAKLDIDGFSRFNRLHGHLAGDTLLRAIAARLGGRACRGMAAGRTGSDELIVIFPVDCASGNPSAALAREAGRRLACSLGRPLRTAHLAWPGALSVAVTLLGHGDGDLDTVLRRLDEGLAAQRGGGGASGVAELPEDCRTGATNLNEDALLRALRRGEFLLHYQPQHDRAGAVAGVEALVRWQQPGGRMVSPACFIPFAEATGLILPLGRDIMRIACAQLAHWQSLPILSRQQIAVNISPRQLLESGFAREIRSIVRESGADPGGLTLELTESQPIADLAQARAGIHALFDEGIRFALDDFGTGYASLASVSRLPLDELKIDRSFVSDIVDCGRSAGVVHNMIALARHLGLRTTAEGVETAAQQDLLARAGCDKFQGYLYAPPLPPAEAAEHILLHGARSARDAFA